MQTTPLQSLHLQPPFSGNFTRQKRLPSPRNGAPIRILAIRRDGKSEQDRHDHKLVDENMIVLKMRIQEMVTKELEGRVASPPGQSEQDRHDHKLVDENMIVLKMRIQEMVTKELEGRVASPPGHWMGWEKEWYNNYDHDVYELVGWLQNLLMDTRPSLALGVVALLIFSVSTPLAVLLSYFLNIAM